MFTWLHSIACSLLAELGCPRLCTPNDFSSAFHERAALGPIIIPEEERLRIGFPPHE